MDGHKNDHMRTVRAKKEERGYDAELQRSSRSGVGLLATSLSGGAVGSLQDRIKSRRHYSRKV